MKEYEDGQAQLAEANARYPPPQEINDGKAQPPRKTQLDNGKGAVSRRQGAAITARPSSRPKNQLDAGQQQLNEKCRQS